MATLDPAIATIVNEAYSKMLTFIASKRHELYDYLRYTMARITTVDAFYVAIYQSGGQQIRYPYVYDGDSPQHTVSYQVSRTATSGWMLAHRRTYRFAEDNGALLARGTRFGDVDRPSADAVITPMFRTRGEGPSEVFGLVSIQTYTPKTYTAQVVHAFELLVNLLSRVLMRQNEDRESLAQLEIEGGQPLTDMFASDRFADLLASRLDAPLRGAERVISNPDAESSELREELRKLALACRGIQGDLVELQLELTEGPARRYASLTEREKAVAIQLAEGSSNAEIADHLTISIDTVKSHVASIKRKYDNSDRRAIGAEIRHHIGKME